MSSNFILSVIELFKPNFLQLKYYNFGILAKELANSFTPLKVILLLKSMHNFFNCPCKVVLPIKFIKSSSLKYWLFEMSICYSFVQFYMISFMFIIVFSIFIFVKFVMCFKIFSSLFGEPQLSNSIFLNITKLVLS